MTTDVEPAPTKGTALDSLWSQWKRWLERSALGPWEPTCDRDHPPESKAELVSNLATQLAASRMIPCVDFPPETRLCDVVDQGELVGRIRETARTTLTAHIVMLWREQNPGVDTPKAYQPLTVTLDAPLFADILEHLARSIAQGIFALEVTGP